MESLVQQPSLQTDPNVVNTVPIFLVGTPIAYPNTAFTSYTYEVYSKLESAPSVRDLLASILDSDPFEELYDCGSRSQFENLEKDLNKLIRKHFRACKKLI